MLRGIEKWCDERHLSVNPSKTELILFTRKLKIEGFQSITFSGKTFFSVRMTHLCGNVVVGIKHRKLCDKLHTYTSSYVKICTGRRPVSQNGAETRLF